MIKASDSWKKVNNEMLLPETFVEITFGAVDYEVAEIVTVSADNADCFSNTSEVVGGVDPGSPAYYATLENWLWVLDGSRKIMPDSGPYDTPGYVSTDDSDTTMTLALPGVRTEPVQGLTIIWSSEYNEYPTKFTVSVEKNGTTVTSVTVTDNSSYISAVDLEVSGYDTVHITVSDWSMNFRRKRIDRVIFGHILIVNKNDILSFTHEQQGDLNTAELPKNHIEFVLDNTDDRWNPLNPSGVEKYLYERQRVSVRYGLNVNGAVEWIKAGTFYLSEWSAPSNGLEARFVARDVFEFMLNKPFSYPERMATTQETVSVYKEANIDSTLVTSLEAGVNVTVYEEKQDDEGYTWFRLTNGWVRVISRYDDNGFSVIGITYDEAYGLGDLLSDAVNSVDLPVGFSANISSVMNNTPAYYVSNYSVAEIVQLCANAGHCLVWQDRDGVLNVQPIDGSKPTDYFIPLQLSYSFPEIELSKPLKGVNVKMMHGESYIPLNDSGEDVSLDNPLISDSLTMAYWIQMVWEPRKSVSGEFRADPRLDLFDMVNVESKYGLLSPVMLTDIKYEYNGSFRATYLGRVVLGGIIL